MTATLKVIAHACGMDVSTVSRALRDDPRVKSATRASIKKLARSLAYKPNWAARTLVRGSSRSIWFVIHNISYGLEQAPAQFAASFLRDNYDYDLLIALHQNDLRIYRRIIDRLFQNAADGAVIIPGSFTSRDDPSRLLEERSFPAVFIDRYPRGTSMSRVVTDNFNACREMVRKSLDSGIQAVIDVSERLDNNAAMSRSRGIAFACKEFGLKHRHASKSESISGPWPAKFAIFATNQSGICDFIRVNSAFVSGKEIVACCFDNWIGEPFPAMKALVAKQNFKAMAETASRMLMNLIGGIRIQQTVKVPVESIEVLENAFAG